MGTRVAILGSTGSIGRSTLDVLRGLGPEWEVAALAAGSQWRSLAEQARQFNVKSVAICDADGAAALRSAVDNDSVVYEGARGLVRLIEECDCDFVVSAIVGAAGLPATLRAVELGKRVGIANKEALVMAGSLLVPLVARCGATILPIDSEHSAIFQCLHSGRKEDLRKIYLTGSGGPFRTWPPERVASAALSEALNHPTWKMGAKITIDSASLMNKALEVIEACWLFDVEPNVIEVIIHPESIIHSMVEFVDGSVMAQLGAPDMRTPIQYALTYPQRRPCPSDAIDFAALGRMHFERPDLNAFPALRLGFQVAAAKGTFGAVLNAANEKAVELFQADGLRFGEIAEVCEKVLSAHRPVTEPTMEDILAADAWARSEVSLCLTS